jgi:hypothetical protein
MDGEAPTEEEIRKYVNQLAKASPEEQRDGILKHAPHVQDFLAAHPEENAKLHPAPLRSPYVAPSFSSRTGRQTNPPPNNNSGSAASSAPVSVMTLVQIAKWMTDEAGNAQDWFNGADSKAWLESIRYIGFDAVAINKKFLEKEANSVTRYTDIYNLCTLLIMRGTNISKVGDRMSATGKAGVEALRNKYGIQNGGGGAKAREVVTLSRIGATYPLFCGLAANIPEFDPKVGNFEAEAKVPKCFSLPQIAACFPQTEEGKQLLGLHKRAVAAFNRKINNKKRANREDPFTYQKIQFESALGSKEEREDWCVRLQLLTRVRAADGAIPTYSVAFTREDVLRVFPAAPAVVEEEEF